jgi:hypothetical protein
MTKEGGSLTLHHTWCKLVTIIGFVIVILNVVKLQIYSTHHDCPICPAKEESGSWHTLLVTIEPVLSNHDWTEKSAWSFNGSGLLKGADT